jgi:hypothetical protein
LATRAALALFFTFLPFASLPLGVTSSESSTSALIYSVAPAGFASAFAFASASALSFAFSFFF